MTRAPASSLLDPSRWRYAPPREQLDYYRRTAGHYDAQHVADDDEIAESLQHIERFIRQFGIRSVLDSGCGTGRGIRFLQRALPDVRVEGNDPSPELLEVATRVHGVPAALLHCSDTRTLPVAPGSFDAVMSLSVLHHVPESASLVQRMSEIAAKAVFIADANYMGQGSLVGSIAKLALTRAGVWPVVKYVQQGFKGWAYSDGDGVFYSYSVFNDLAILQQTFSKVMIIPVGRTSTRKGAATMPLLRASVVLVAAFK